MDHCRVPPRRSGPSLVHRLGREQWCNPVNESVFKLTDYPSVGAIASTTGEGTFQPSNDEILYGLLDGEASASTSVIFGVQESAPEGSYSVSSELLKQGSSSNSMMTTSNGITTTPPTTATVRIHTDVKRGYDKEEDDEVDTSDTLYAIHDWEVGSLSTAEILLIISELARN